MSLSAILIGSESLTRQCGEMWLARGHRLTAVITGHAGTAVWAKAAGIPVLLPGSLPEDRADWILSIANLSVIGPDLLARATRGAVNFHDGPLPAHAGLNAPVWAILAGDTRHGITWHLIEGGVDEGDVVAERSFDIAPADTALTLNTRCFEAALDSFPEVMAELEAGVPYRRKQQLPHLAHHRRADRPAAQGLLDFTQPTTALMRLIRALDHGSYANPLTLPKILDGDRLLVIGQAEPAEGRSAPGKVLEATPAGLVVATADGAIRLTGLRDLPGAAVCPTTVTALTALSPEEAARWTAVLAATAPREPAIARALADLQPASLAATDTGVPGIRHIALTLPHDALTLPRLAAAAVRLTGQVQADVARRAEKAPGMAGWQPLRVDLGQPLTALAARLSQPVPPGGFPADLILRDPRLKGLQPPMIALSDGEPLAGALLTLTPATLHYDAARLTYAEAQAIAARLTCFVEAAAANPGARLTDLPILPERERHDLIHRWNATDRAFPEDLTLHAAIEAQATRTPDAPAVAFEGQTLTYAQLNARANRAAHVLMQMGVSPGTLVGLATRRSPDLIIGALAILKAGGAYVPMDPAYPADRIALYAEDSGCPVIVTQAALEDSLPPGPELLALDHDGRLAQAPDTNPGLAVTGEDLAYMIYTSGSTGRPKGVMVEHCNVQNFFTGMDDRIGTDPGTWLAVTSLSFDISVLELFWTLARGFKVVISSDEDRATVSSGRIASAQKMDFSLYYWGNDDGAGPKKYELLLEGAKFADSHGFVAVWTPERHFHAFGGPYPNPSVTGAAVAAVTKTIGVRAGSCVAPLHHPARIAEEWAVIDNLTNGGAGMAIASGWHPDDFVLRPENTPPDNRPAMFAAIDQVRRLWRGEAVEFPTKTGTFAVTTQPRPVSAELPIWVTTAGNPETWREAGQIGANVLTHLLGQSIEEVADKIGIYHAALRAAGHDPANFKVTLMLHTYLSRDRDRAREVARGPMKDYLRSAAGLIKQYAWAFPAFKKPQGVTNPAEIDIRALSPEELEGILDFAFQRYFEDSGLFGTVEDALARVEGLKRIGVTEVACLIDYGIAPEVVMEGLYPLAEVVRRANSGGGVEADDFSIAAQLIRHKVSHLQCTPSMARMIAMNDEARAALAGVKTLMVGGEALPGALVADLKKATQARLLNMYGPTETTIWSSVEEVLTVEPVTNIGTPIANTRLYVLDDSGAPVPVGAPGELWIGGAGVARGYWQRPDLTEDRFKPDPFHEGRMYRTGDLGRRRADGKLDFLGRTDHQVKLRGYRIELGEIEAALESQPGVTQAVVLAREDQPGDKRLVAYITGPAEEAALKAALAVHLPDHMVPAHVVRLDSFPLTPNRKVDRKALPAPQAVRAAPESFEAPEAGLAEQIATIWARVLGVPKVGARDNFFSLGGHSLLAVQAHRELRDGLGLAKLTITDIFRFPVLSQLVTHLEGPKAPPVATEDRAGARLDAMARRRAMRAGRVGEDA